MSSLTTVFHMAADFFCGQAPGSTDRPFTFEADETGTASIIHASYVVPGLTSDTVDFSPSDVDSSFLKTRAEEKFWMADVIGGGFGETRLSLLCGYGTGVRVVPDEEIDALITAEYMKIDTALLSPPNYLFRNALKDRFVFRACSTALQDGIRFWAYDEPNLDRVVNGTDIVGFYNLPIKSIQIATKRDPAAIVRTIKHELLHYVFDKSSSVLGNIAHENPSLDPQGISVDHFVIEVVMEKLLAQAVSKKGLIGDFSVALWYANFFEFKTIYNTPLFETPFFDRPFFNRPFVTNIGERSSNKPTTSYNITLVGSIDFPSLIERHLYAWNQNDHSGIMSVLDDPDFARAAVAAQLIPLLPHPEFPELESIPLLFTPEMYQDMAFLHAQRYAMYVHGIYELSLISKRTGKKMKDLFRAENTDNGATLRNFGWHTRMDAFFTEFFEALITDPMEGVLAIERRLRKP